MLNLLKVVRTRKFFVTALVLVLCFVPLKVSNLVTKVETSPMLSPKQQKCLAEVVYYESRSESTKGQMAVAFTVLNRVKSPKFPKSICKVVKQSKKKGIYQFSYLADKKLLSRSKEKEAWKKAQKVALDAVFLYESGSDFTKGADHYHTTKVSPDWSRSPKMKKVKVIQNHIFYKSKEI